MDKRVSIIIPIYNGEDYIEECLNSIFDQTYQNIEVIVVNDGSTDKSYEICASVQKEHPEMILKTQENKGVSSARNVGLIVATGDYISFVDADDFVPKNYVESFVRNIDENVDFVCCPYSLFESIDDIQDETSSTKEILNRDEIVSELLLGSKNSGITGKLIKKSIVTKNDLKFDEDIIVCEELLFFIEYAVTTNKTVFTNETKYYIRQNDTSFNAKMQKQWDDVYLQRLDVCERIKEILKDNNIFSKVNRPMKYQYYFSNCRIYEFLCASTEKSQKTELKKEARRVIRKYNYLYIWYMFKTKNVKKANMIFFIKNIFRGFGYQS